MTLSIEHRPLGQSELRVSALSLGSWLTFERLPRETGLAIMRTAREHGITFLDDARYNDPTGTAPMPTGYSEVGRAGRRPHPFGEVARLGRAQLVRGGHRHCTP